MIFLRLEKNIGYLLVSKSVEVIQKVRDLFNIRVLP